MTYKLPALKDTIVRQTRVGNLAVLFLAIVLMSTYALDKWRGEPFISAVLAQEYDENHNVLIREDINVKYPNRGSRNNVVYDQKGRIMCLKNLVTYWQESRQRIWYLEAFVGCEEPKVPFQVCTIFSVYSKGGIEKKFGGNRDFCTPFIFPEKEEKTDVNHGKRI